MKAKTAAPAPLRPSPTRRRHARPAPSTHHASRGQVRAPAVRLRPGEVAVDLFAGGGGASEAIRQALGIDPYVAVNHDQWAIGMHRANHPDTQHFCEDVWEVDPRTVCAGHKVGLLHGSPDCTHFSQAKGGQPRDRAIRSLSWVLLKWAGQLHPRIVTLENVRQIQGWTRLIAKRDKATGRVVTLDVLTDPVTGKKTNRVADPGEHVPVRRQFLVPDKRCLGRTWRKFVNALRAMGYEVEWFVLTADDYEGADTDRQRLFMVARCDGEPIVRPKPNRTDRGCAARSIDWSIMGSSIFNRPRPLRPNTIRRLLDGACRGNWPEPYIQALEALRDGRKPNLRITREQAEEINRCFGHQSGLVMATGGGGVARPVSLPIPTITGGGHGAAPHFIRPVIVHKMNSAGGRGGRTVDESMPTCTTRGAGFLAEPIIAPYYGSGSGKSGQPCSRALPTVTAKARFGLAEPVIVSTCNSSSAGVRLSSDALRTITTARGGDMAVGEPVICGYSIDILYRMLVERELFNGQGFPRDYVIDVTADGTRITRERAVKMAGNSVSPPMYRAILEANLDPIESVDQRMAA
ncbi:MAG: hypothetical protein EPN36_14025 [Rhodanobacteraceae bacterium]|nr:MAG: hypothetical protein EPN36_14025 [Rhodanobacteraceae bacterium]